MNFTQNNEPFNDEDAHTLASEWIQSLEFSLLSRLSEETWNFPESSGETGVALPDVSAQSEGTKQTPRKQLVDSKYASCERKCSRSEIDQHCQRNDQHHERRPATSRVDLDLIRQKRLEYFQSATRGPPHRDDVVEAKLNCPTSSMRSAEGVSHRYGSATADEFSPRSYGEDDEIRLDLWGLKDAVKSGEIDLEAYIRDVSRTDPRIKWTRVNGRDTASAGSHFMPDADAYSDTKAFKENADVLVRSARPSHPVTGVQQPNWGSAEKDITEPVTNTVGVSFDPAVGHGNATSGKADLFAKEESTHVSDKKGKDAFLNELTGFVRTSNKLDASYMHADSPVKGSDQQGAVNPNLGKHWVSHEPQRLAKWRTWRSVEEDILEKPLSGHFLLGGKTGTSDDASSADGTLAATENMKTYQMTKVCPTCHEINSKAANWCIECGSALVTVKPSFLSIEQGKQYEKQCEQTKSFMLDLLKPDKAAKRNGVTQNNLLTNKHNSKTVDELTNRLDNSLAFAEGKQSQIDFDYKRRWLRSSTAWSTYDSSELSKPSSLPVKELLLSREINKPVKKQLSPGAFDKFLTYEQVRRNENKDHSSHPSHTEHAHPSPLLEPTGQVEDQGCPSYQSLGNSPFTEKGLHPVQVNSSCRVPPLNLQDVDSYERILTLIRSQRDDEPLPYLCLPDEILLHIFSYLPQATLSMCSVVCQQFYRIAMDNALWQSITLEKKSCLTDSSLAAIGKRRPASLTMSYCRGEAVTPQGLRALFRQCGDTLEELDFSGCSGGELIGESILLHVAARCSQLKLVDASWSNVSDNGVQALVESVERLECLCLNGCQAVTDACLESITSKHGQSLRIFEVFGCFNITPVGITLVAQRCQHLHTLNIGQCHKITDSAIGSVVSGLRELEHVDLRGCKQIRDAAVKKIVRHCSLLSTLVLANCPLITDSSLVEIASCLPGIRSLDICGCAKVTDAGIRALSRCCHRLEHLDLSSTGVSHKSVTTLANYCSQSLCSLKLSFCTDVSDSTVKMLVKYCKRLTTLHLYGCKLIRNSDALKLLNENLKIEC